MAKKAMINKQQKPAKFTTRAYTRCKLCGRPHAVLFYFPFYFMIIHDNIQDVKSVEDLMLI